MYCGNCGTQTDSESQFCPHCGARVGTRLAESLSARRPIPSSGENRATNKLQTILVVSIPVVVIALVAVWFLSGILGTRREGFQAIVGRWEEDGKVDEFIEFFRDNTVMLNDGKQSMGGSWAKVANDRIKVDVVVLGTTVTLLLENITISEGSRMSLVLDGREAHMTKLSASQMDARRRLVARGFVVGTRSAPMCSIAGSGGPCRVQAFAGGETTEDPARFTCSKLDKSSYVGRCVNGALDGLAVINADGSAKRNREAFVAHFSAGKILYPALHSFLDNDPFNLGVDEQTSSYGCVYYGLWDISDEKDGCVNLKKLFGEDIFSESNARALKAGSFDLSRYIK